MTRGVSPLPPAFPRCVGAVVFVVRSVPARVPLIVSRILSTLCVCGSLSGYPVPENRFPGSGLRKIDFPVPENSFSASGKHKNWKRWGGGSEQESRVSPESGVRSPEFRGESQARVQSYKLQEPVSLDSGLRTPDSGKCLSKTFQNIREYDVFRQFRQFRLFPESGESFRRSLFPGSLRGAFSGGQRIFRRSPFGLIWRAFSGVRRAFPEWPCFGGSEDPTFRNAIFRSWTPDFFIIGAIFRSPEAS